MAQTGQGFRIFVSSTFSDMKAERDALQSRTFPKLRELCERNSARFQAIDLRWGVSDQAGLDQKAVPICLAEIERCHAVTKRPNFMVLMGDRYGWQPPPYTIPADEFEQIAPHIQGDDKEILEIWYKRDDNAVPPEYVLQPREGEYIENKVWWPIESQLLTILRNAVIQASLTPEQRYKYETAVTEQEITEGIFNVSNAVQTAVCFFRSIENLPHDTPVFSESDAGGRTKLSNLRKRLRDHLPVENIYDYQAQWLGDDISTDHIDQLCDDVYNSLSHIILEEIEAHEAVGEMEAENQNHEDFRVERSQHFIGREDILAAIQTYLTDTGNTPLAVHGQSGVGKSALIANSIQQTLETHTGREIICRFIGVTPQSSDTRTLLGNLCREIASRYGQDAGTIPIDYKELAEKFRECLEFVTADKPLILFLDALDQLTDAGGRWLNWLPADLPEHVHLVVSTLPGDYLNALQRKLPEESQIEVTALGADDGETLLASWLSEARRTLQSNQHRAVMDKFNACGLPLYLKLAFEEARLWHSYGPPADLAPDIPGIIGNLFDRLDNETNHGTLLVSRSLGYIAVAHNGLSEIEILDVLARDKEYFDHIQATSAKYGHNLPEERIPIALWSRLYLDLAPYLTERGADGTALLGFYHRQFAEAVAQAYLSNDVKTERHAHLAYYFDKQPLQTAPGQPNLRKVSELPYQLAHGSLPDRFAQTMTDFDFMQNKLDGSGVNPLIKDYELRSLLALEKDQDHTLRLIHSALTMSAHALAHEKSTLAHQLIGRLMGHRKAYSIIQEFTNTINLQVDTLRPYLLDSEYHTHNQAGGSLLRTLSGHSDSINSVAFSPDGKTLASASSDNTIKLWDPQSGQLLNTLTGHESPINSVAFSPDGKILASTFWDSTIKLWDMQSGQLLNTLTGHEGLINPVAFSPDGKTLASTSSDNTIKLWDPQSGQLLDTLSGHSDSVNSVTFSPNGKVLASASWDGKIKLWDPQSGQLFNTLGPEYVTIMQKDPQSGQLRPHSRKPARVNSVAFSPDGKTIASGQGNNIVNIWDSQTGQLLNALAGHESPVNSVTFSPDGKIIASASGFILPSASYDNTIKLWDPQSGQLLNTLTGHNNQINSVAFSPNGKVLASASGRGKYSSGDTIKLWNPQSSQLPNTLTGHSERVNSIAFSPDGRTLASASEDRTVLRWNVQYGQPLLDIVIRDTYPIDFVAFSPDGQFLASAPLDRTIKIWYARFGPLFKTLTGHSDSVISMAFSPDSKILASASWDNTVKLWDFQSGQLLNTLRHNDRLKSVAFSPDGKVLASAPRDHTVMLWDPQSGQLLNTLSGHGDWVNSVAFSPDSKILASASQDQTIKLWDPQSGQLFDTLTGHLDQVKSVAFSPDGKTLASASQDQGIKLWDTKTGSCLLTFVADSPVNCVVWSPVGDAIAAAESSNRVLFLRVGGVDIDQALIDHYKAQRAELLRNSITSKNTQKRWWQFWRR